MTSMWMEKEGTRTCTCLLAGTVRLEVIGSAEWSNK